MSVSLYKINIYSAEKLNAVFVLEVNIIPYLTGHRSHKTKLFCFKKCTCVFCLQTIPTSLSTMPKLKILNLGYAMSFYFNFDIISAAWCRIVHFGDTSTKIVVLCSEFNSRPLKICPHPKL